MKKVFIIHGFEGSPNGGWRPWLMSELEKLDIYACALPMPGPERPLCDEWVAELKRQLLQHASDEIYLVGHSLGVSAILRYLEKSSARTVEGAVLVSGPAINPQNPKLETFFQHDLDYHSIRSRSRAFALIHGDDDPLVPLSDAHLLARELGGTLHIVSQGGHLNGSSGWRTLPICLQTLKKMCSV